MRSSVKYVHLAAATAFISLFVASARSSTFTIEPVISVDYNGSNLVLSAEATSDWHSKGHHEQFSSSPGAQATKLFSYQTDDFELLAHILDCMITYAHIRTFDAEYDGHPLLQTKGIHYGDLLNTESTPIWQMYTINDTQTGGTYQRRCIVQDQIPIFDPFFADQIYYGELAYNNRVAEYRTMFLQLIMQPDRYEERQQDKSKMFSDIVRVLKLGNTLSKSGAAALQTHLFTIAETQTITNEQMLQRVGSALEHADSITHVAQPIAISLGVLDVILKSVSLSDQVTGMFCTQLLYREIVQTAEAFRRLEFLEELASMHNFEDPAIDAALIEARVYFETLMMSDGIDPAPYFAALQEYYLTNPSEARNQLQTGLSLTASVASTVMTTLSALGYISSGAAGPISIGLFAFSMAIDISGGWLEERQQLASAGLSLNFARFLESERISYLNATFVQPVSIQTLEYLSLLDSVETYNGYMFYNWYREAFERTGWYGTFAAFWQGIFGGDLSAALEWLAFQADLRLTPLWPDHWRIGMYYDVAHSGPLTAYQNTRDAWQILLSSAPNVDKAISGRITRADNGTGMDGVTVALSSGAGSTTTAGGGYFSRDVPYGWTGTVTPQFSGWQFTPVSHTFVSPITAPPSPLAFAGSELPSYRIITSKDAISVMEGSSSWFGIKLSHNPGGSVVVQTVRSSGDSDLSVGVGASRTFTSANWDTFQQVRIDAAEDDDKLNGVATFTCSASGWAPATVIATEQDNDGGSLQVYIQPPAAAAAGGRWRIAGGAWFSSGETSYDVPWANSSLLEFKHVDGWFAPPPQMILINAFEPSIITTGTYVQASSGNGQISVLMYPSNAVSAGAMWRVDSGTWQPDGATVYNLSAGSHSIDFLSIDGYVKPGTQVINVNDQNTSLTIGWYSPSDRVTYISPGGNIQNVIDAAPIGQHVVLNPGTYNLSSHISVAKNLVLRSLNGAASVILDLGGRADRCLVVSAPQSVVSGLTLTGSDYSTGNGGGAYCTAGTLINVVSHHNTALTGAGFSCSGQVYLYNCVGHDNESLREGGGLLAQGAVYVESCVFKNNYVRSSYEGSGFHVRQGVHLRNCLSVGNSAGGYADGAGGAVYASKIEDSVVIANISPDAAGGLYVAQGATILNTIIENNSGTAGGGVYVGPSSTDIVISNCVIRANRASWHGGGVWARESLRLIDCIVENNSTARHGGAVATFDGFFASRTIFDNNTAAEKGGVFIPNMM